MIKKLVNLKKLELKRRNKLKIKERKDKLNNVRILMRALKDLVRNIF